MRASEFTKQGLTEGFEEEAQEYKSYLLKTLPQIMRFLKGVRGAPSEKQMLDAIEIAYTVMKRTGDVKQAAKAKKEFLDSIMSQDKQGVAESDDHPKSFTNNGLTWTLEHLGSIDGKDLGAGGLIDIFKGYQDINSKGKFRWFIRGQRTGVLRPVSSEHTAIRKFLHPNVANNDEYKKFTEQGKVIGYKQGVAEGSYREGGSITHDGVEYDFDRVMSIAEKLPTKTCSVDKLSWILKYDTPNKERLERADITVPLIVTKSSNSKLAAIDGLHRLAKAVRDNVKTLPVKYVSPKMLPSAKISKVDPTYNVNEVKLDELYGSKDSLKNWDWNIFNDKLSTAIFLVGDEIYRLQLRLVKKNSGIWDIEFVNMSNPSDNGFSILGTGNASLVLSNTVEMIRDFLEKRRNTVKRFTYTAIEPSRQRLYRSIAKRVVPDWKLTQNGENFTLTRPSLNVQGVAEGFNKEAEAWKKWQIDNLDRKMEMLSRLVKKDEWLPSEEDHYTAIKAGYNAMIKTGNVNDAAKAISDTFKEIQRRRGVAEDTVEQVKEYALIDRYDPSEFIKYGKQNKDRLKPVDTPLTLFNVRYDDMDRTGASYYFYDKQTGKCVGFFTVQTYAYDTHFTGLKRKLKSGIKAVTPHMGLAKEIQRQGISTLVYNTFLRGGPWVFVTSQHTEAASKLWNSLVKDDIISFYVSDETGKIIKTPISYNDYRVLGPKDRFNIKPQGVMESASGKTPSGYTWSFEHGGEVPYKSDVEVNTFIRVRDSKGKTVLGVWADVYKDNVEVQYSEVFDKKLRGKGIYTDFLKGLSKHYNIISDQDQNNAARGIYKKLGAAYNNKTEKHTLSSPSQGVAEGAVDEMALSTYKTMGDFSKPGPFTGADKKLVPHPKNIEKATQFFEQTPFDFRLFFSHLKGTGKYSEHGPMSPDQIRQVFGKDSEEIINGSEDAITVVYVGNKGDAKVMLTPWMMAHRFGHAINAGAGVRNKNWTAWGEAENYFFQTVNSFLEEHYGKVPTTKPPGRNMLFQLTSEYNALFNAMGTQRSSKSGQIRRPYEFLYELFAQYLGTGKVTLNPLPTNLTYGRRVFGNPTKYMNIKPEFRDAGERQQATDSLAYTMELLFNDVLSGSVGKIFVM